MQRVIKKEEWFMSKICKECLGVETTKMEANATLSPSPLATHGYYLISRSSDRQES